MRDSTRSFSDSFPNEVVRRETAEGRIVRDGLAVEVVDAYQAWARGTARPGR
jgi:hypothetical protein